MNGADVAIPNVDTMEKIDFTGFDYRPGHFNIGSSIVAEALWQFLLRPENIIRLEALTTAGRPAIEALSIPLWKEFGGAIADPSIKRFIGYLVRQIMVAAGYEVDRPRVRISRPGLFSTGMTFRRVGRPSSRSAAGADPRAWFAEAEADEFNQWLENVVDSAEGRTIQERLACVAASYGVNLRGRTPTVARIELGIVLRVRIPQSEYSTRRPSKRAADAQDAERAIAEAQFEKNFGSGAVRREGM